MFDYGPHIFVYVLWYTNTGGVIYLKAVEISGLILQYENERKARDWS